MALKYAVDSRLNVAWVGLIAKTRPPSDGSRIDATDDDSARYGLRLRARSSITTWRIGIVFQEGNRSPRSSRGRPNWLNPATASTSPVAGRKRKSLRAIETAFSGGSAGRRTAPPLRPLAP